MPSTRGGCHPFHPGLLLTGCSYCFLAAPKITSSRAALLKMAWVLPCDSLIKKIYNNLSYRPISWKGFLNYNSFLDDSSLYQIGNKTKTTGTGRKRKTGSEGTGREREKGERKRGEE